MFQGRVEAQIAVNGFKATLLNYVHESADEQVLTSDTEHVLGVPITPQCTNPHVSFGRAAPARRFVNIRHPVFRPVATPLVARVSRGRERCIELSVSPERFAQITGHGGDWRITDLEACADISAPVIEEPLLRLARELAEPGFAATMLVEALSVGIMIDMARYLQRMPASSEERRSGLDARRLARIRDYIESSDETAPSLSDLARLCGMSERHLIRRFRETTGETVKSYVERIRLSKAKALLSGTELPLKEISARLGFASPSGFSVAFRRLAGETPTAFRRHFRGWPAKED
jgi:AraC family transcriptional regulator